MPKVKKLLLTLAVLLTVTVPSLFADVTTPESMLDAQVTTILADFAADIVPTVLAVIAIVVPAGLAIWAIGFGIKKGIAFMQKRAGKSL